MKIKSNPLLFGLCVALILTVYRYVGFFINLNFGYVNDLIFFLFFGISIIIYQKKNEKSSFARTYLTAGLLQIAFTILLYESTKLIIIQPDLTEPYWTGRAIVSITIIVLGLLANFLFLLVYFLINKKSFSSVVENSVIIDN